MPSDPQFLPPFADVPEFTKDFQTFKDLREMVRPIRQITDNMENSMMVSGSEAYHFARNYYQCRPVQRENGRSRRANHR